MAEGRLLIALGNWQTQNDVFRCRRYEVIAETVKSLKSDLETEGQGPTIWLKILYFILLCQRA